MLEWHMPIRHRRAVKPITYDPHAVERIAARQLSKALVERTVRAPSWTEPDPTRPGVERRFAVLPELGGRVLRVAVRDRGSDLYVITAVIDRNARRRGSP